MISQSTKDHMRGQSIALSIPALLMASAVVSAATALVVYPWVSLWFQPPNARDWAPVFFPILFIAMPLVAGLRARRDRRSHDWLFFPMLSWLIGTSTLYLTWHAGYDWQRLPPWSLSNYVGLIGDSCFGGVFLGMWFPGLAWVALMRIRERILDWMAGRDD